MLYCVGAGSSGVNGAPLRTQACAESGPHRSDPHTEPTTSQRGPGLPAAHAVCDEAGFRQCFGAIHAWNYPCTLELCRPDAHSTMLCRGAIKDIRGLQMHLRTLLQQEKPGVEASMRGARERVHSHLSRTSAPMLRSDQPWQARATPSAPTTPLTSPVHPDSSGMLLHLSKSLGKAFIAEDSPSGTYALHGMQVFWLAVPAH